MVNERRRYPRAGIEFNVTVDTPGGQSPGRTLNLSPLGIKVAPIRQQLLLPPGTGVQIRFPTRDHALSFSLAATVQRADPDGLAFRFGNLTLREFKRLKELVDTDMQKQWQELLEQIEAQNSPSPAARGSRGNDDELARWQGLLTRLGFDSLQLPTDGTLTRQWRDFLKRLEETPPR